MTNLSSGKGSMGKLLNDDAFYQNIKSSTKELELLLQDVRLYPTRYVNICIWKNKPYVGPAKDTISTVKKLVLMSYLDNILFAILLAVGFGYFLSVLKN
jgi:phospholipid/cholesterol/gamma-HCH transport system substrate-binding protein